MVPYVDRVQISKFDILDTLLDLLLLLSRSPKFVSFFMILCMDHVSIKSRLAIHGKIPEVFLSLGCSNLPWTIFFEAQYLKNC